VELLWRMAVPTNPIKSPIKGLEVAVRKDATTSLPRWLMVWTSKSMERRKNARMTATQTMAQKNAADRMERSFNGNAVIFLVVYRAILTRRTLKFST
jgi:hypothetical protein